MILSIKSKTLGIREVLIDDDVAEIVSAYKWCLSRESKGGNELVYAVGFVSPRQKGVSLIRMHRLIVGASAGQFVDHINGNTLDNRRENLRIVSHAVNMQNTRKRLDATSKYKGVDFKQGRWRARLHIQGRTYNLGTFVCEEDTALAYNRALEVHGSASPRNVVADKRLKAIA